MLRERLGGSSGVVAEQEEDERGRGRNITLITRLWLHVVPLLINILARVLLLTAGVLFISRCCMAVYCFPAR